MKKENLVKQDEYVFAEEDFQMIIAPNDVLEEQLSLIYGGGAPGMCQRQICGGGSSCNGQGCTDNSCGTNRCSSGACNNNIPGHPGAQ